MIKSFFDALVADELYHLPLLALIGALYLAYRMLAGGRGMKAQEPSTGRDEAHGHGETTR